MIVLLTMINHSLTMEKNHIFAAAKASFQEKEAIPSADLASPSGHDG
jgi:hypothetical protein